MTGNDFRFPLLLLGVLIFLIPVRLAAENGKPDSVDVTFFYSHQPPFEYTDINGLATGSAIENATALFDALGWSSRFEYNSVSRGLIGLHSAEYDFSTAVSPNYAIKETFWVSKFPLYYIRLSAVRLKTTQPLVQLSKLETTEFAALSQNHFTYVTEFLEGTDELKGKYSVDSIYQGLRLVELGKLPYFLTYTENNDLIRRKTLAVDEMLRLPVYLIISKQHPKAADLLRQIDQYQSENH